MATGDVGGTGSLGRRLTTHFNYPADKKDETTEPFGIS